MVKVRLTHRQRRHLFLFNDLLIYAVDSHKGLVVKGRVPLEGTRVERLPDTEKEQNAFALVDKKGKGYTWVGDDAGCGTHKLEQGGPDLRHTQQSPTSSATVAGTLTSGLRRSRRRYEGTARAMRERATSCSSA